MHKENVHNLSSIVKIVLLIMLRTNVCQNGFDVRKCCLHEMPKDLALVGPGLGSIIGPNGDFSTLPDISKWILTLGMILGRLELFAILVLFLPSFWRN